MEQNPGRAQSGAFFHPCPGFVIGGAMLTLRDHSSPIFRGNFIIIPIKTPMKRNSVQVRYTSVIKSRCIEYHVMIKQNMSGHGDFSVGLLGN